MKAPTLRDRAATACKESKVVGQAAATEAQSGCRHYWEIEAATAQLSKGVCKRCGCHKLFSNFLSDCLADPHKASHQEWVGRNEWEDLQTTAWNVESWVSGSTAVVQRMTEAPRS